jgi:site-specific DNA recombinase
MKVALYARVSSEGQADRGTIDAQSDFLRRYAELNELDVVGEYFDEAITGPTPLTARPAGKRLVKDAQAKKFTKVLFYRVDRFARSLRELLEAQALLTSLGVDLQSATEPFDTSTPMGRFMFQLLGGIAELEKSVILERTTNGKARVAKDGRWPGGPAPFGYAIVDHKLAPNENEAPLVREVYRRLAEGSSLVQEAKRWSDAGIHGRNGGYWNAQNLGKLIHSQVNKGEVVFRGKHGVVNLEVPPLVSEELWSTALAQLKQNSTRREEQRFMLLRGKIHCGHCGGTFVGSAMTRRNQVYYRCVRSIKGQAVRCKTVNLNARAIEDYVWRQCIGLMEFPQQIVHWAEDEIDRLASIDQHRSKATQKIHADLAAQEAAKQRIIRLVRLGKITEDDAAAELDALNVDVGKLHARLSEVESSQGLAKAYQDRLIRIVVGIKRLARSIDPDKLEDRRRVVEILLQGIDVRTTGEGKDRRAELTFRWIGQAPSDLTDPEDWNVPIDAPFLDVPGVKVFRLTAALNDVHSDMVLGPLPC